MKFFITGSTGGLGAGVLSYFAENVPHSDFAASSSRAEAGKQFEDAGLQFRHADYDSLGSLTKAFAGVEKLLFVSSSTFDNEKRTRQHGNVVKAAMAAGVNHVYYTSLAFGGYSSDSEVAVQQAHLATEALLASSGLAYTSIREGIYTEAFPLFLNWFPSTSTISLPSTLSTGALAFASRAELAEATAKLMIASTPPQTHINNILLFSGPRAYTFPEIIAVINRVSGRDVQIKWVDEEEYVRKSVDGDRDRGGKPELFFRSMLSWYEGIGRGEGSVVSGTLGEVLGREPEDGMVGVEWLLRGNMEYTWHQNYMRV